MQYQMKELVSLLSQVLVSTGEMLDKSVYQEVMTLLL